MSGGGGKRRGVWRIAAWILLPLVVLLLTPYAVAPLYRVIDPVSTLMVWRWITRAPVERQFVPIAQMAPALPFTVIGSEDGQFCRHRGVDWRGLREALWEADSWSELRGGSTITQQVAKNLFLWQGRSVVRKALELPLAIWIDLVLPKRRILEIYLNIAEWGPAGQFGAEAGARYAFETSVRDIDARQAALMAAVLPNPHVRSARRPGTTVRRLAGTYERRGRIFARTATCLGLQP